MRDGKWLQPRHADAAAFEKDFPQVDPAGLDVYCPGCRAPVKLARKGPAGRIGGWCRKCNRGVSP